MTINFVRKTAITFGIRALHSTDWRVDPLGEIRFVQTTSEAINSRRDEVFLVSKVVPSNASRAGTVAACSGSLTRLSTDRVDCYLLYWRGPHPLEETFAAFEHLREQGKILSWGVSNFDVPDLEEAWKAGGQGRIACNQVLYNLESARSSTPCCPGVRRMA